HEVFECVKADRAEQVEEVGAEIRVDQAVLWAVWIFVGDLGEDIDISGAADVYAGHAPLSGQVGDGEAMNSPRLQDQRPGAGAVFRRTPGPGAAANPALGGVVAEEDRALPANVAPVAKQVPLMIVGVKDCGSALSDNLLDQVA